MVSAVHDLRSVSLVLLLVRFTKRCPFRLTSAGSGLYMRTKSLVVFPEPPVICTAAITRCCIPAAGGAGEETSLELAVVVAADSPVLDAVAFVEEGDEPAWLVGGDEDCDDDGACPPADGAGSKERVSSGGEF